MRERILVALSGGVDSLSTALLLQESYDVVGLYIQMQEHTQVPKNLKQACSQLGIALHCCNVQKSFEIQVVNQFCESYLKANTPNICTHCNAVLKIPTLLSFADNLAIDKVATGHYARIVRKHNRYLLQAAIDSWKDQSYMLYKLDQKSLSRLVLPLGDISKTQVKEYAMAKGLNEIAIQRESYSLCFTQGASYGDFLLKKFPHLKKLSGGKVIDTFGKQIGTHKGYPFYTVGQFRGLDTPTKQYINTIDPLTNTLIVGTKTECFKQSLTMTELFIHQAEKLEQEQTFLIKIRGKDEGTQGKIRLLENTNSKTKQAVINFSKPVFAPMSGQDVVAYSEDRTIVLGGTTV